MTDRTVDLRSDLRAKLQEETRTAMEAERHRILAEQLAKENAEAEKQRTEREEAKSIISSVPVICMDAAKNGMHSAKIMRLNYDDFKTYYECNEKNFKTTSRLVWEYLVSADLHPKLIEEHDGSGMNSWHYIWAYWD